MKVKMKKNKEGLDKRIGRKWERQGKPENISLKGKRYHKIKVTHIATLSN